MLRLASGSKLVIATNRGKAFQAPATTTKAFTAQIARALTFAIVAPQSGTAGQDILLQEIAASELASTLGAPSQGAAPPTPVLLYVHGFNNSVDSAIRLAASVANKMSFHGNVVVFSWPSQGSLTPRAYRNDIKNAGASTEFMVELIKSISAIATVDRLHILAHSLGNEPAIKSLVVSAPNLSGRPSKLGEIILCSPDVGRDEFISSVSKITGVVRGVTLWASRHDIALGLARTIGRGIRAGQIPARGGPIIMDRVATIDVSSEASLWLNHNAYEQVPALFADLSDLLADKPVRPWENPEKKRHYFKRVTARGVYWQYLQ